MTTACLPLLCLPILQLADATPDAATPQQAEAARIYQALDEKTAFEFVDKPLMEAMSELARLHNINLVFDSRSLHQAGVDQQAEVNLILNGVKLKSALKIIFEDLGLDYSVHGEVLMVSSAADVKTSTTLHTYNVSALLTNGDIDALAAAVREQIPETPEQTARISGYRNLLLVTGNRYVQESVQQTLKVLTKGLRDSLVPGGGAFYVRPTPANRQR